MITVKEPVELNPDGIVLHLANRHYSLTDCVQEYECSKATLCAGIPLCNQFTGTGRNKKVRMLGDFGSELYIAESIGNAAKESAANHKGGNHR